jgi:hypothetical protein
MTPTTPSPISPVKEFEAICDLIPEDAYWGMPLTPDLVRHIRAGCTAATAGSAPVAEVRIHTMWSSGGCTVFNDYLMTDYTIRTLKASDLVKGQVFPPNDGSYETVLVTNPYAESLTAKLAKDAIRALKSQQDAAIESKPEEQSRDAWISTAVRVPEEGTEVLCINKINVYVANWMDEASEWFEAGEPTLIPTHWQPLPAPPVAAAIESQRSGDGS